MTYTSGTSGGRPKALVYDIGGYLCGVAHTMDVCLDVRPGEDVADFKHIHANVKIPYPFRGATRVNLIAVGAGIAPMVQALEKLLDKSPGFVFFDAALALVLAPGAGSLIYRGLATVIVGGMAVSTLFTLFLLPALLQLGAEKQKTTSAHGIAMQPAE